MAGLATAEFSSAMKTLYLGPLNDQTYRSHVLLDRLEKNSKDVSGNFAYVPLLSDRNPAVGSRKDASGTGPLLPVAGRQTYTAATYTMGLHYGRGQVSGAVRRKSRNSEGAFTEALDSEMAGLMRSLPDDLNRQLCGMGNGRAGTLSATQSTDTAMGFDARDTFSARIGDRVHFADITAGNSWLPTAGTTVANILYFTNAAGTASATNTHHLELAAAAGSTVTSGEDALYFGNATTLTTEDSSWGSDIYGIQALVDDGAIGADDQDPAEAAEMLDTSLSFGGINRATNAFWRSTVSANGGTLRPITQATLFETWLTAVAQNGAEPGMIEGYCEPSVWGSIGLLNVAGRVYNDFVDTVKMGWKFIEVQGSKVFYDRDMPFRKFFWLGMENIFLLTQNDYEFIDEDGSVLRVLSAGNRDAWEFSVNRDVQLGANNLRAHVQIRDLSTTMTVTGARH